MNYSKQTAFALSLTLILGACGGGSDNNDENTDLVGSGSLSECFNPVLFQDGTFYTVVRDNGFGKVTTTTSVTTNIEWNGTLYTRRVQEFSQLDSGALDSRNTSYFLVDFDNQIVEEAGRVFSSFDDETGDLISARTQIFTPPIRTRFNLNAGDTFSQTYEVTSLSGSDPTIGPINEVEEETKTDRFLGIESITVATNTVDTCRVESVFVTEPGTVNEETEISTVWLDKENGLFVQFGLPSDGEPVVFSQIESAVINGASVF